MTGLLSRPRTIIANQNNNLKNIISNLKTFNAQYLKNKRGYLGHYASVMQLMSPLNILRKGFAIVKKGNKIYTGNHTLKPGDKLDVLLSASKLSATLNQQTNQHATDTDL